MGFLDFKRVDWEIFSVLFKDIKFEPMLHNSYNGLISPYLMFY